VERKIGINHKTLTNWENNVSKPSAEDLVSLSKLYETTVDALVGQDKIKKNPKKIGLFTIKPAHRIPVIGSVRCGVGGLAYEYIDEYITIDDARRPDEMRAFHAVGDSMEGDYIFDGDICIIHLQSEVPNNAVAVVVICDDLEECEGTIKHIHKEADGTIILQASNPKYPPRVFSGANANRVHIVGEVVEVRHKFK
jgi:SOS-response transcriptional repressor LexA